MENELIKIETREGFGRCVSLRELHEGLGIKTQFTKWAIRMIEYGFEENIDYILISQKRLTNNPKNPFYRTNRLYHNNRYGKRNMYDIKKWYRKRIQKIFYRMWKTIKRSKK